MEISEDELRRRLRAARQTSRARSRPSIRQDHITDSLGFQLFDAGFEAVRRMLYRLGVLAMLAIFVVMMLAQ